jgi:hypothetical protein
LVLVTSRDCTLMWAREYNFELMATKTKPLALRTFGLVFAAESAFWCEKLFSAGCGKRREGASTRQNVAYLFCVSVPHHPFYGYSYYHYLLPGREQTVPIPHRSLNERLQQQCSSRINYQSDSASLASYPLYVVFSSHGPSQKVGYTFKAKVRSQKRADIAA